MQKRRSPRLQALLQFALFVGILLAVNIVGNVFYTHIDLTAEKRFTLTQPTKSMLNGLKDRIYVEVLLDGEFPAGFKHLQTATRDMLDDFRSVTGYIDYQFDNPNAGTVEDVNARRKTLSESNVNPVNLRVQEEGGASMQLIYPFAIFHYGNRQMAVNLLENQDSGESPDEALNRSVNLLEYKFANAIKKLMAPEKPIILLTKGHGELIPEETADFEQGVSQFYQTARVHLDSVIQITPDKCALLIVAKPTRAFSEKDKFKIDQYVMNGGKVMWLIDRMGASLDSMRSVRGSYIPNDYPLNLEDQLFKYGIRIQPDLVVDMECTKIQLVVGQAGGKAQTDLFDWYYHPKIEAKSLHPLVKNLDRLEMRFCSSIDTIRTKTPVKKTVVLSSSRYSRLQFSPIELNFNILRYDPDPAKFDKGFQPVGVVLEGVFPSAYENRVSEEMASDLRQVGVEFKKNSAPTRMLVVSDGDLMANRLGINPRSRKMEWLPPGFNNDENHTYANNAFMMNAVEYLIDADGVIVARSKDTKLRLLDLVRAKDEKLTWQLVNIGVPLLLLALFGALFMWLRKRKYAM